LSRTPNCAEIDRPEAQIPLKARFAHDARGQAVVRFHQELELRRCAASGAVSRCASGGDGRRIH
jgi:hypothetical protein